MRSATFHVMEDNFTRHGGQLLQRWNIYTNFAAQSNCLTKNTQQPMNSSNTKNGNTSKWNSSTPILTRFRFVSHYLRQIHNAIKKYGYFTASTSSSAVTSFCSPVVMFLRVNLLSAISDSPASTTKGMFFELA